MAAVLTIGSSLIDIFVHSDEFHLQPSSEGLLLCQRYGEKIEVSGFALRTGGGGSNVAVGLARLGHAVKCISELGRDDWADIVVRDLTAEHVDTSLLVKEKKEQTGGSVILVGADGGRTVLVHRGAASQLDPQDIPADAVQTADWIHLSSISGQIETLKHIFALRKQSGKTNMSWNPGSGELSALVAGHLAAAELPVQTLIVNKQEWEIVAAVQQQLQAQIPEILITDGANGIDMLLAGISTRIAVEKAQSVDDTGAGDAFATGYVAARLEQRDPQQAVVWAKANSAAVVQQVGAKPGLLTKSALEQVTNSMS